MPRLTLRIAYRHFPTIIGTTPLDVNIVEGPQMEIGMVQLAGLNQ